MKPLLFLTIALLSSPLPAQQELYRFDGDQPGDRFGGGNGPRNQCVELAGDVNADGWEDWIVGAPYADLARVFSGRDGSTLFSFRGPNGSLFGTSVDGAGDTNRDGHSDLIIGARSAAGARGMAYLYSGADGSLLYSWTGYAFPDILGFSVSTAGDVDRDGFADVVIGAPENPGRGYVQVRSGATGNLLFEFQGSASNSQFGWCVSTGGDINADGWPDILVGANGSNASSISYGEAYSGRDGSLLYRFVEPKNWADEVSEMGDLNGDGHEDFWIGAGWGRIYSGVDGSVLFDFPALSTYSPITRSAGPMGDLDGDGLDDFCLGDTYNDLVYLFSSATGAPVNTIQLAGGEFVGGSLSSAGDQNGDGVQDLLIGAPRADHNGTDSGSAYVYLLPGPSLRLTVPPLVRGQPVTLTAADALAGSTTWFCYSTKGAGPWTHPLHGFTLLLSPPLGVAGAAYAFLPGPVSITVTVPSRPPVGLPVWIQAAEALGNPPNSFRVSNQVATFLQ